MNRIVFALVFVVGMVVARTASAGSCGSDSDCGGYGKCSSGSCGHCGSDSDCNGHGKCSSGTCGHCGSDSDCNVGKCSSSKCGSCGSDSDCKGGRCSSGRCSNAHAAGLEWLEELLRTPAPRPVCKMGDPLIFVDDAC